MRSAFLALLLTVLAACVAAYDVHEMTIIIVRLSVTNPGRYSLFSVESTEKVNTMISCVHHGYGRRYYRKGDGQKYPCVMSCHMIGVEGVKVKREGRVHPESEEEDGVLEEEDIHEVVRSPRDRRRESSCPSM